MGTGACGQVRDRPCDADRVHPVGALHDRNDESGVVADRDPHVHEPVSNDVLALQPRVDVCVLQQRVHGGAHDHGEVGDLDPVPFLERVLDPFTELDEVIDVDLHHRPGPRRSLGRGEHVLRDRPSDVRDGNDLVADARAGRGHRLRRRDLRTGRARGRGRDRSRSTGRDDAHHVRLRDPAAAPGSRDLRQVEVVFLRQPANERGKDL